MGSLRVDWRCSVIFGCLLTSFILLTLSANAPTDYYRDIYFYADQYVATQIIQGGYLPPAPSSNYLNFWGKIPTRIKLPLMPIFLAELGIVTNESINQFYLLFPSALFLCLVFYLFFRRIPTEPLTGLLLAGAAGTATVATVSYATSVVGLGRAIVFLAIFTTGYLMHERYDFRFGIRVPIILTPILFSLFFWYPPHYAKVSIVFVLVASAAFYQGNRKTGWLIPIIVASFLFLQIFEVPMVAYVHFIGFAIVKMMSFELTLPTGGNTGTVPTVIAPAYYSLIPLVLLLPLSIYGGFLAIRLAIRSLRDTHESHPIAVLATCWGAGVAGFSVMYMATATSFLVGRPYLLAQPVMFVGTGFALARGNLSSRRLRRAAAVCLLALVFVSVVLQAGSAPVQIQTYEPGVEEVGSWVAVHEPGLIYGDTKVGAPLAAKGYFRAKHPRSPQSLRSLYYSDNYTRFADEVGRAGADAVIITEGMKEMGLFALTLPHEPIPHEAYDVRITKSDRIYANGHASLLTVNEFNRSAAREHDLPRKPQ